MDIKQIAKKGFEIYSLIYPAHRRTLRIIRPSSTITESYNIPDVYFVILKKEGYLQALFAYKYIKGNFYSLMQTVEICLPHEIYSEKDISITDVVDSFFLSKFESFITHSSYKAFLTPHFSSYLISGKRYRYFPALSLRKLFDK